MAYICIDFGDKRIGIAKSDGVLATSVGTIVVTGMNDAVKKTAAMINEHNGHVVVIGMPKNMDSTEGYRAKRTREFAAMLEAETGITPVLFDERLTTSQAYVYMNEIDFKSKKRKGVIDALSAKIILQDYLDFTKGRG
jgi:putative Holliday junction resolvase